MTRDGHEDDEDFEFNWYACTRAEKDTILDLTFVNLSSEIKLQGLQVRTAIDPTSGVSGQNELRNSDIR